LTFVARALVCPERGPSSADARPSLKLSNQSSHRSLSISVMLKIIAKHARPVYNTWSESDKHFWFIWKYNGLTLFLFSSNNIYDNMICLFSGTTVGVDLVCMSIGNVGTSRYVFGPGRLLQNRRVRFRSVAAQCSLQRLEIRMIFLFFYFSCAKRTVTELTTGTCCYYYYYYTFYISI